MQFLSYLIRRCAGPKDEVPGEILPREVESSSRRLSLPWRHKKQLERQEGEEVPADTRRAPHVSRVSSETWPLPRRLPLALLPCGLYLWTFFQSTTNMGWEAQVVLFFWSNMEGMIILYWLLLINILKRNGQVVYYCVWKQVWNKSYMIFFFFSSFLKGKHTGLFGDIR